MAPRCCCEEFSCRRISCMHREPPSLPRQVGGVSRRSSRDGGGGAQQTYRQNPCPPRGDRAPPTKPVPPKRGSGAADADQSQSQRTRPASQLAPLNTPTRSCLPGLGPPFPKLGSPLQVHPPSQAASLSTPNAAIGHRSCGRAVSWNAQDDDRTPDEDEDEDEMLC